MKPIDWNIIDEWQPLEAVMVGIGAGMGEAPALDETYDPLSRRHVLAGTYPKEEDVKKELNAFARTLEGREIRVLRPDSLGINQVFTRDIGVIIDDTFIMTHMVEDRVLEQKGLHSMLNRNPGLVKHPPDHVLMEGGDIMPMQDEIWVGYADEPDFSTFTTARTNQAAVEWLEATFPHRRVRRFELNKSDSNPGENALHLDCCIAPLGLGHLMIHKAGFKNEEEVETLCARYDHDRILEMTSEEMKDMQCNVLSLAPNVVVSGSNFHRTNAQMRSWGYEVIEVNLSETSKMGGLLRCSTLPLRRTPTP